MNGSVYQRYAAGRARKSPFLRDCARAYLTGGCICALSELLRQIYLASGLTEEHAGTVTSLTLIFTTALLTGLGWFDRIAKKAGAGTLVPITGFANAVTSAAMDSRSEGYVFGVGGKIFLVAGPVLLYGLSAGVLYGFLYWLTL